jgi:hypothetical protein
MRRFAIWHPVEKAAVLWCVVCLIVAIILACTADNPTDPNRPGGEPDEKDLDEKIYTRYDLAYLASDGIHVYTTNFWGNPENRTITVPIYAIVLYGEQNQVVRLSFGG